MKKVICVLSGGQDSTTVLALMLATSWAAHEVHAITFDYNQRHAREIQSAKDVAAFYGVTHEVISLGPILNGTSPLTNPGEDLEQYIDAQQMDAIIGDRVEKTFVPMRNALFLTIAANRAACIGANAIYTGVCEEDNANYPDCRSTFIHAQAKAINTALGLDPLYGIQIYTPLIATKKHDAIKELWDMPGLCFASLALTHTAYDGQYPPTGHDHATVLRAASFERANLPDPLVIRANRENLMPLPTTHNYADTALNSSVAADVHRVLARVVDGGMEVAAND